LDHKVALPIPFAGFANASRTRALYVFCGNIPARKNEQGEWWNFPHQWWRVQFLRQLCASLKLRPSQFLIKYKSSTGTPWPEYASLLTQRQSLTKRTHDCILKEENSLPMKHVRWLTLTRAQLDLCVRRSEDFKDMSRALKTLNELKMLDQTVVNSNNQLDSAVESSGLKFIAFHNSQTLGTRNYPKFSNTTSAIKTQLSHSEI
jgi:hypothetical protein